MWGPWAASFPDWDSLPGAAHPAMRDTTVYFIKRSDGSLYATTVNRHLYGEIVIDVLVAMTHPRWSIQTSPVVADNLKKLQAEVEKSCTASPVGMYAGRTR